LKESISDKKCAVFDDSVTHKIALKAGFRESSENMPRKWENSAKSGKVGTSAVIPH